MKGSAKHRLVSVAAGAAIIVGLGSVGAVADALIGSQDIKDNSVAKVDIAHGAVAGSEIRKKSVTVSKLGDDLRTGIRRMAGTGAVVDSFSGEVAVPIEGPFLQTPITTIELPRKGTYTINTNVFSNEGFIFGGLGEGIFGVVLATEDKMVGLDLGFVPLSNSVYTVSVNRATEIQVYNAFLWSGPALADETVEGPSVMAKVSAIRENKQFVRALAPGAGMPDMGVPVERSVRSMAREMQKAR
jgi:hypothetical protein